MRTRGGANQPFFSELIEFDFKGRHCTFWRGLYSPDGASAVIEDAELIVRTRLTVTNAIPPSPGFAPSRDDGMDMKAAALVDKLDGFSFRGDHLRYLGRRRLGYRGLRDGG